jgi:hypothetical protein
MAMFKADYPIAVSQQTIVPGVPGKVILVTRICFSGATNLTVTLLSDPGGGSEQALTPALRGSASTTVDLVLGRERGLLAERGKALGLTTAIAGPTTNHGIMVWYELVD